MPTDPSSWSLTQRVTTAHGEIAWDRSGDGPPVVLVHGTPSRSVLWRDVAPLLAGQYTVYVHGQVLAELVRGRGVDAPAQVAYALAGFLS